MRASARVREPQVERDAHATTSTITTVASVIQIVAQMSRRTCGLPSTSR